MNTYFPIIGIALLIVLFAFIAIIRNKGKKIEPDYRIFFILGITWLPLGISTDNPAFLWMGIVFMLIGLANKDKWKKEAIWAGLSSEQKKTKLLIIGGLTLFFLAGIGAYIFAS